MAPEQLISSLKHRLISRLHWQGVLFALAALIILSVPLPQPEGNHAERVVRVEASEYQFSPAEIYANPGDRVTIELTSADVMHGFSLDGYDFSLTAEAGQTTRLTFVADKTGVFRFRCSIPCGNLHPFMSGKLQVGQDLLFWRATGLVVVAVIAALWTLRRVARRPSGPAAV